MSKEKARKRAAFCWRQLSYSLTEHVQAHFLGFLSRLVLGDASVISFIHFLDIFYYQFRTILVQAVLIAGFKDDVVTVVEGNRGRRHVEVHITRVCLHNLKGRSNNFLYSLTMICWGVLSAIQQRQGEQTNTRPVLC